MPFPIFVDVGRENVLGGSLSQIVANLLDSLLVLHPVILAGPGILQGPVHKQKMRKNRLR